MSILTNALYLVSTAFLVPVIILILGMFIYALILLGGFFGLYVNRLKFKNALVPLLEKADKGVNINSDDTNTLKPNALFYGYFSKLKEGTHPDSFVEKTVTDFELACEKEIEGAKSIMRLGPMVGLMGTLIPMGPALVGLAQGDIASMALNMQVAFSTTVVGIFIGGAGFIIQLIKQRWFIEDINNFEYLATLKKDGDK